METVDTTSAGTGTTSEKITVILRRFASLALGWLIVLVALRLLEWLWNGFSHQFPEEPVLFLFNALLTDFIFFCKLNFLLLLLFLVISFASRRAAAITYLVLAVLFTLGYLALIQYFNSTLVPLGADLYGYSWKEIKLTVGASGKLNFLTLLLMVIAIAAIITALIWLTKKIRPGKVASFMLTLLVVVTSLFAFSAGFTPHVFQNEYSNNLSYNKLDYFLGASYNHFYPEELETDIYADSYIGDYGENTGTGTIASFNYTDEKDYPFLHGDSTEDVLSPFLNKSATPPNIVILLVEGLGRAFTNQGAYLGNFTPFIDSLSQHSLYWENFLSGGGRTFAVLPTVLGSLPFGKNGFNELGEKMPPQLSLMSLLKKNGYNTGFYYCGDASFDNMDIFLKHQNADRIRDKSTFPAGYTQLPASNGFSWGYGDKELFRFLYADQQSTSQPTLQVLLTVATHSPFLINEQEKYNQAVEKRMDELKLTGDQKAERRQYKAQFASILYADDALKQFFAKAKEQPGYSNTIFLITGDHRMPEIPMSTKIDRYHVPLILYSPMLQRTAKFQSLSTHFDIGPTLLAYLKNSYALKLPSLQSWMGSGLDTARSFRNIHAIPLMQTKTDLIDFVMGPFHLNGSDVFRINNTLNEDRITDPAIIESMRGAFGKFQQKNQRFIQGAKLIPDTLFKTWKP
ncbi:LTA synthase family protein [Pseudoflavitalea sp. G-6-1-2]|uniref:LTA synthase family protein n=1 Tax=Pseudoflavitalea sp. G-6-1-2 TaxID=2728841 RepID=UPI00146E4C68|nr:LTA synthase family protein [Pseudoflavitalea sp. G-6-1-2]NML20119.1 LTA synthase family protein [Pseudoflavitalea sp. G-6-1-2]